MQYISNRIKRRDCASIGDLAPIAIRLMGLSSGLNEYKIYKAWDKVSNASNYTVGKFYRNGTLFCTMSSSVVRSALYQKRKLLVDLINSELVRDKMFNQRDKKVGLVKTLILK